MALLFEVDVDVNGPFFLARFRETVRNGLGYFQTMEAALPRDSSARTFMETLLGRDLINVIACEGVDRWVRCERLSQWLDRLDKVRFVPKAFHAEALAAAKYSVESLDRRFSVDSGEAGEVWGGLERGST